MSSNAVTFTVPSSGGPFSGSNSVTLVPNLVNMVVGGTQSIDALDTFHHPVAGLTWTSSNPAVATLSSDDPPVIIAVSPGETTITAGNAATQVTVWAGPSLPTGMAIWSNPGDGFGVSSIVPAVPSSTGVADVFALNADCNIQAIKSGGTTGWTANIGVDPSTGGCNSYLPDFQGGVVVYNSQSIYRLDGMTGQASPWQYAPSGSTLSIPVVHTDGTIFTFSTPAPNIDGSTSGPATMVGIDPSSGDTKVSVAFENSTAQGTFAGNPGGYDPFCGCPWSGAPPIPPSSYSFVFPPTTGPLMIAGDGYAYAPYSYSNSDNALVTTHLRLLRVGPSGDSYEVSLGDWDSAGVTSNSPSLPTLITNADQGVLASYSLTMNTATTTTTNFYLATTSGPSLTGNVQVAPILEQTMPVQPVLQRADGSYVGTVSSNGGNFMIAFTGTGSTLWTVPNDTPQIATADGGVIGTSGTTYQPVAELLKDCGE